jgi:hypothetical protein
MTNEESTEPKGLSPRQADAFRARVTDIISSGRKTAMDLCWAAYESDVNMTRVKGKLVFCWAAWGYESWEDYVGKELDLHMTTAYAYKKIWETFYVTFEGAWDPSLLVGITKMRHLSSAPLTKSNINAWLRKAAKMTCKELSEQIFDHDGMRSFAVPVTSAQLKVMQRTLDEAKTTFSKGENMSRGQLMTNIMREWLELKANAKPRLRAA